MMMMMTLRHVDDVADVSSKLVMISYRDIISEIAPVTGSTEMLQQEHDTSVKVRHLVSEISTSPSSEVTV